MFKFRKMNKGKKKKKETEMQKLKDMLVLYKQ